MTTTYTLTFDDPRAAHVEATGGKGANLSLLTQRGFPVPAGFVVTAAAYRDFIAGAAEVMRRVPMLPFGDASRLVTESEKLRADLNARSLPAALDAEVKAQLTAFDPSQAFAVRSSSTMEDLANAAFAGQHETFLNCVGLEDILAKIKACFLSLWYDRAIAYRHQQGFDHQQAAMAVVVQCLAKCDVAGVAFSIDPVAGDLTRMVIDANYGLGESVVSGEADVDHFVVDRKSGKVIDEQLATKTHKIVSGATGTEHVQLSDAEAAKSSLSAEQIAEIASLVLAVEQSYRFPQDIEWGIAAGQLKLLQSRPVTTIPPRWTRDESAERFPQVITPLTWDFVERGFHRSLVHSFRIAGFPPFSGQWFGMHGHYIYGNQNAVEIYGRRVPFTFNSLEELLAAIPRLREEYRWVQELPVAWARDLDYYLIRIGEFMSEPLEQKDLKGLWRLVLEIDEQGAQYFLPNIAISITQSTLYRLLMGLLTMSVGPDAARGLFDSLLAFCETKTGTINKELFELATMVRATPALEELLNGTESKQVITSHALEDHPAFARRFERFLRDHGHREIEFDAYVPTWVEAPWVVLDNIRLILQSPLEPTPAQKERELKVRMQQAEVQLFSKLPPELHFFFFEVIRLTRLYTSVDDLEHYQTTRLTLPLRRALRELGQRLVKRGVLLEPMDVFFFHCDQLDSAIVADTDEAWQTAATQVREQKQAYLKDRAREPQWILGQDTAAATADGDTLKGLPGSSGQAEGQVFIVHSSDDFAKFPKGAVLVARTTNPTWTPLFYSACAVITESGGPLSHGAVTAREMRIPAVMRVQGVMSRLANGQKVAVDGTRGTVQIID